MEITRDLLLILHFIAMAGLLGGLLASQSKLNKGVLHSSLLALVTGLGLVGIRYSLVDSYPDQYEEINHSVVGIKLVILNQSWEKRSGNRPYLEVDLVIR